MSFSKISRARNLLSDARRSIGGVRLDCERHAVVILKMVEACRIVDEAIAMLGEAPIRMTERDGRVPRVRSAASSHAERMDSHSAWLTTILSRAQSRVT
jgi:hypothetical protein